MAYFLEEEDMRTELPECDLRGIKYDVEVDNLLMTCGDKVLKGRGCMNCLSGTGLWE